MAEISHNNPTGRKPSSNIPEIRTFQVDGGQIGNIQNSVNMFRGDVGYRLNLLDLPGRNGLNVNLTLGYQSNVTGQVETWNMTRPTGILGLGWSLPLQAILVNRQGSAARSSNQYYLIDTERANLLVPIRTDDRGRTLFETQSFEFWDIAYDPRLELWEVVKEDGTTYRYGGKDSGRDTVQWGVSWGNWLGASANASGQQPNAVGWNLAEIENVSGDRVIYGYRNHAQNVGKHGDDYREYTKASYLDNLTDVLGRTLRFCYGEKIYDRAKGICEYQDSTKRLDVAGDADKPDAYQSSYETKYLDHIDVTDAEGRVSTCIRFDYEVCNYSGVPSNDPTHPYLYKRYLTGIVQETFGPGGAAAGVAALPGFGFTYWTNADEKSGKSTPLPGALRTIMTPDGGTATYLYSRQAIESHTGNPDLPLRFEVKNPLGGSATPRVWYGPDYTLITWYDSGAKRLAFGVYRWVGRWVEWPSPEVIHAELDLDGLRVSTQRDFFCLSFANQAARREEVYLFRKDEEKFGSWVETFDSIIRTGVDEQTQVTAGEDFVVLCNPQFQGRAFWGWTWSWRSDRRGWEPITVLPSFPIAPTPRVAITGSSDYYVAASFVPRNERGDGACHFALFYRDPSEPLANGWKTGSTWNDDLTVYGSKEAENPYFFRLSPSRTFFEATFVTALKEDPSPRIEYELRVYQWDTSFRVPDTRAYRRGYTADVKKGEDASAVLATVAGNALVGNSGNLLRDVGGSSTNTQNRWVPLDRSTGYSANLDFAYGSDIAVIADRSGGGSATRVTFDPNIPSRGGWREQKLDDGEYPPAISGDYLALGARVYYRGSDARWDELPKRLPASGDFSTTQNRAPRYILCDDQSGRSVQVAFLRNGRLQPCEELNDPTQRTHTPDHKPRPGAVLAGAEMFVTFPADTTFDKAETLYLYQATQGTVTSKVYDSPVVQVSIDPNGADGAAYSQFYRYDPRGVTFDVASSVTQYSKVSLFPASAKGEYGRTDYYYSNGVSTYGESFYPPGTVFNFNHVLNGLLLREEVYSAGKDLVSQTTTAYQVYRARARSPGAGASIGNVPYAWFRPVKQVDTLDGVRRTTTRVWDEFSGQVRRTITTDYDSNGAEVELVVKDTYGYDIDAYRKGLLGAHILDTRVTREQATGDTVTALEVTTWKQWGSERGSRAWAPSGGAKWRGFGSADFDFDAWSDGAPLPVNWVRVNRVVSRSARGLQILEQADVDEMPRSIIYDKAGRVEVARFPNASLSGGEAAYYGFEAYEENPGWTLVPGDAAIDSFIVTEDPNTGERCLRMPGADAKVAGARLELRPRNQSQSYLFSCWVRTESGLDAGAAKLQVTLLATGGRAVDRLEKPIDDTGGHWRYLHQAVDLAGLRAKAGSPSSEKLTLRLELWNRSGKALHLDDLRCSPLLSAFTASVYQPSSLQLTAKLGARGELMRYLYDDLWRQTGEIGPDGGVASLETPYKSRQGGGGGYDPSVPNSLLSVKPRGDGFYDDFRASSLGPDWSVPAGSAWAPDPKARTLRHGRSAKEQTITLDVASRYGGYGVRAHLAPAATPTHPVTMSIGSSASVRWSPQGRWELLDGARKLVASADQERLEAGEWLIVGVDQSVLFFYRGRQVLAYDLGTEVSGAFSMTVADELAVRDFCAFAEPGLAVKMTDGAGREIQTQVYEGPVWILSGTLYDQVGREAIRTKPVRRGGTAFGYWQGLVTSVDWSGTGAITGEAADYYSAGGDGFSDDRGYPVARTCFDDSPLSRIIEVGAAGTDLAIDPSMDEAARHTVRYSYGKNEKGYGLPVGKYFLETTRDRDGRETYEVKNGRGQLMVKGSGRPDDAPGKHTVVYRYNAGGQVEKVLLPNAFDLPPGTDPERWTISMTYDFLGRVTTETTPDLGDPANPDEPSQRRFVYDPAGRRRFHQTPELAAKSKIAYTKYDALGRIIEAGLCDFDWTDESQSQLQARADKDRDWPPVPAGWTRRYRYDGDGSDPSALLRLVASEVKEADAQSPQVEEDWRYDLSGNVIETGLTVPDFDAGSHRVGYRYDRLGSVTRTSQESEGGTFDVFYCYNNLGLVQSIGRSESEPSTFASYTYTADSSIATETLNGAKPLVRTYRYNSPSWLAADTDSRFFDESLHYWPQAGHEHGYYDGSISAADQVERWAKDAPHISNSYRVDGLKRLTETWGAVSGSAPGGTESLTYDANGNIRTVTLDGSQETLGYSGSTNRLQEVVGAETLAFGCDLDGNTVETRSGGLNLAYDPYTGLVSRILVRGGKTLDFAYGSRNDRVFKRVTKGDKRTDLLYIRDQRLRPVAEGAKDSSGKLVVSHCVYGPTGLIAVQSKGKLCFVIKDRLGSTRAVVDDKLKLKAAYRYSPFGEILVAKGDRDIVRYLYTGQEYDAETGLYNFNARLYDPRLRRFLSADPAEQFASPYLYAANNPLIYTDPSGRVVTLAALGMAALIGAAIGAAFGAAAGLTTGIVASVKNHWSFGEALWKTTLFTLVGTGLGAVSGAALGVAGPLAEAVGQVVGSAVFSAAFGAGVSFETAWHLGTVGAVVTWHAIELGATVGVGSGLGALSGAFEAATVGANPLVGAGEGALAGAVTGVIGFGVSNAVRFAKPLIKPLAVAAPTTESILEVAGKKLGSGAAASAISGGIWQGQVAARKKTTWDDALLSVTLGALWGGLESAGSGALVKGAKSAGITVA